MAQGAKFPDFTGAVGGHDAFVNFGDMAFYQRIGEGSNMSIDSVQPSMHGGSDSVAMSVGNSSVGSNDPSSGMLGHPGLKGPAIVPSYSVGHSVFHPRRVSHDFSDDALAQALMDFRFPTETLKDYEDWAIDLGKLHVGMPFAQGAFGRLYKGTYNGVDVAIKLLERPQTKPEKARMLERQFVQEVMMLATLRHPNIVKFVGACRKPGVWCIVTEFAKGGSLRNFLRSRDDRPVPLKLAVKQALDVARGMAYVHDLGFIHRDLKSDNLLISGDKSIQIADFGVARIEEKTEGMTPETGTYRWMAPEMIQHRPYNQKVDVYSFGVVLWELVTGKLPFAGMTAVQAAFAVVNKGSRPDIPHDCLPALAEIIARCWDSDPDVRPTFAEIVVMLEQVEMEVLTTVRKARFRFCIAQPMTLN
ncbi:hypothetical protein ACP4OV_026893 [Aristida adscensionis]